MTSSKTRIFFDVDGVLIDGFHTNAQRRNRWDIDLERDLGIHHDKFQEIFKTFMIDVLQGRLGLEEELEQWLKRHDYDVKAWQMMQYWFEKDSKINKDLYESIATIAKNPSLDLYIATNQEHNRARYLWDVLGFKHRFKKLYYSADIGCLKSDPNYFLFIERDLSFDPRSEPVYYFDDDPVNIKVAADRGWNAVLFDTADDFKNHPVMKMFL